MRILFAEDDEVIAKNVTGLLTREGYVIDCAYTLSEAEQWMHDQTYDCIVLDRGFPDGDSVHLVPYARRHSPDVPILFLSARTGAEDVVSGLDAGGDDYLAKPFLPEELLARVRALIRRGARKADAPKLTAGNLSINTNTQIVTMSGQPVRLSPKEYALLEYLLRNKGKTIPRQTLLEHVWGESADMFSNTVDVHIRYLRKKIDTKGVASIIVTVKGMGYRI